MVKDRSRVSDRLPIGVINSHSPFAVRPMDINWVLVVCFCGDGACLRSSQVSSKGTKGGCNHIQIWEKKRARERETPLFKTFFFLSPWSLPHHLTLSLTIQLHTKHKPIGKIDIKSKSMGSVNVVDRLLVLSFAKARMLKRHLTGSRHTAISSRY